jgi:hypothetical protein
MWRWWHRWQLGHLDGESLVSAILSALGARSSASEFSVGDDRGLLVAGQFAGDRTRHEFGVIADAEQRR